MFVKIKIISVQHIIHESLLREVINDAALLAALDKLLRFVVITQLCVFSISQKTSCVYFLFHIKHHVALLLIITAPRMRLVQSTLITTKVSEHWGGWQHYNDATSIQNVVVVSPK